jgi:hypothetical protein
MGSWMGIWRCVYKVSDGVEMEGMCNRVQWG